MKPVLDESQLLSVINRQEWRDWLKQNYRSGQEIWLVYYKKNTGKLGINYNESIDEALCFGWIDSTIRKIDEDCYARRFSRRKPKSTYSEDNKVKLKRLIAQGLVVEDVLATLGDLNKL